MKGITVMIERDIIPLEYEWEQIGDTKQEGRFIVTKAEWKDNQQLLTDQELEDFEEELSNGMLKMKIEQETSLP